MRIERIIKLEKSFAEQVHNIYHNAARFRWTNDFTNSAVVKLREQAEYKALPRYAQSFVEGVLHHCRFLHDKLMVFSYEIDGVRMMLTEERYRKVNPQEVHEKWSHTGCFVYKEDPTKLWTEPTPKVSQ